MNYLTLTHLENSSLIFSINRESEETSLLHLPTSNVIVASGAMDMTQSERPLFELSFLVRHLEWPKVASSNLIMAR